MTTTGFVFLVLRTASCLQLPFFVYQFFCAGLSAKTYDAHQPPDAHLHQLYLDLCKFAKTHNNGEKRSIVNFVHYVTIEMENVGSE